MGQSETFRSRRENHMGKQFAGLDIGTSACKAAVFPCQPGGKLEFRRNEAAKEISEEKGVNKKN